MPNRYLDRAPRVGDFVSHVTKVWMGPVKAVAGGEVDIGPDAQGNPRRAPAAEFRVHDLGAR